jgi:hypothetical protein
VDPGRREDQRQELHGDPAIAGQPAGADQRPSGRGDQLLDHRPDERPQKRDRRTALPLLRGETHEADLTDAANRTSPSCLTDRAPARPLQDTSTSTATEPPNSGYPLFYVSPDGANVQAVSESTSLTCSTGGGFGSSIAIEDIPIEGQTTFKATQVKARSSPANR